MNGNKISMVALALIFAFGVIACEKGPAEKAGEKIDNATEKMGNKIEDAKDKAGDKLEEAGDKIKDKTN